MKDLEYWFIDLLAGGSWQELSLPSTVFVGYHTLSCQSRVLAIVKTEERVQLVLDHTPFYAESGGQVGDRGEVRTKSGKITIEDVQKQGSLFIHVGEIITGTIAEGDIVKAEVLFSERRRIQSHHSATHLLQAALKQIVDPQIAQASSLVDSERLRFDFNLPRAVSATEIEKIEQQINRWILEGHAAEVAVMPIAEAKKRGAVAMFGEKYGDEVRVIDFPGMSMELCGGTHVSNTNEIGLFKIISESGVAAGIRRIEAVAGQAVLDYLAIREQITKELSDRFKARPEEILDRVSLLQTELKNNQKELENLKKELALTKADRLLAEVIMVEGFSLLVSQLDGMDGQSLQAAGEKLCNKLGETGVVVLGSSPEAGKVSLVAAFGKQVNNRGLHAGKFISSVAQICGGGGGGRPNIAQAGGKDPDRLLEALKFVLTRLKEQLK